MQTAIISVNTATLTGCGLTADFSDERNLIIPEMLLHNALKKVPAGAQVIVTGHHPLGYLQELNEPHILRILAEKASVYLFGHMHEHSPVAMTTPLGECYFVQAGSLYSGRDSWNGYSIISTVPGQKHHRVTYRKWHEARRKFGVASDLSDDGVVFSSPDSKIFWSSVTPKLNFSALNKWRADVLIPFLDDQFGDEFSELMENSRFVVPEFERDHYIETLNGLDKAARPEIVSFDEVCRGDHNYVIAAPNESGKTTLIRRMAKNLADLLATAPDWSVPVVFKFNEIRKYVKSIENIVKTRIPSLPEGVTHASLLELGLVTIFVDDADLKRTNIKNTLDEFVKKYPQCRYIFLTSTVYLQGAGIEPVVVDGIPFKHLRLRKLKKSQLLSLIESHGHKDPMQADRLLQRMTLEASSLNVPITPVTGTFLIQIYTEDSSQPLINRANLVERYIEISLEKFGPQDLLPGSFDFHNKCDLLSFVAEYMCRNFVKEISESKFLSLIGEYLDEYGLVFSQFDLLNYFVEARILERFDASISFRIDAFKEYFSAVRMISNDEFRAFVQGSERYLAFCNEITFYAAISRKDKNWLEELYSRFEESSDAFWRDKPEDIRSGLLVESFQIPSKKANEDELFAVERKVFNSALDEKDRRALLDDDSEDILSYSSVESEENSDPGAEWLANLTLLSSMLKNMELIPNSLKAKILERVIHGWIQFLALTMGIVPALAKDKRASFGGIEYLVLTSGKDNIASLANHLFMYVPIAAGKVATQYVGTEKLRMQLETGIGNDIKVLSASQQFMRATILSQLGVDGLPDVVEKAAGILKDYNYLNAAFVRMLYEVVIRFRLPDADLSKIRLVAANTIAGIEGKTGQRAAARKAEIINLLSNNRRSMNLGKGSSESV